MAPAAKTKKATKSATTTTAAAKKAPAKNTKATTKKSTEPKEIKEKNEEVAAGNKRKRVTFTETEAKPSKSTKKKATGKKEPEPKEVSEESDAEEEEVNTTPADDNDDEELTEEQEEALRKEILGDLASSDEGDDSSDEEDVIDKNENVVSLDGTKMKESMAETKKSFDKKSKSSKATKEEEKGVIYLGRIPHGFYEKEMKGYFSQFGDITRLRLSRNKKTGKSKHYGFIEFASADVANIVAETMHNYLLFGHLLQCKLVPAEKVHEELFKGCEKVFKPKNYALLNRKLHNKPKNDEQLQKKCEQLKQREEKMRQQLKDAGIEYDFPGF